MIQLLSTLQVLGVKVGESVRNRMKSDAGQTAAEYMGIIVVVAIIIAAIAGSGLGTKLAGDIGSKIDAIFGNNG